MGFLDIFKKPTIRRYQNWRELGRYTATFTGFGSDVYKSDVVRSCIRPLAEFTSKADAKCSDEKIARLLNNRPNMYMNGHDFLYKLRTMYELKNTAFVYIQREGTRPVGFYPVPYQSFEALECAGRLFIRFRFASTQTLTAAWEDLAVLRKDYNASDIAGDDNRVILDTLELLTTANEGVANAIKSTANLRGILKSTKGMLSPEDIKRNKDTFVKDYMNLENEGGIAALDATQEFTPITMNPTMASHSHLQEFREDVYRYYGVNDDIIMGKISADQLGVFYELRVEPFLVALSRELTSKVYTQRELTHSNWIIYEANKLQFASMDKKISLFKEVVQYGGMTINEWREGCNLAPLEGGDTPIMRLDAAKVDEVNNDD